MGRASIALEQKGQKLGSLRYMSLDVKQLYGVVPLEGRNFADLTELSQGTAGKTDRYAPPPPPPPQPEKVTVTASVQCAFQIQ